MKAVVGQSKIEFFGKPKGHFNDKFNRVAKLAQRHEQIIEKLDGFINVQGMTQRCLCALMCKIMFVTGIRIGNEKSAEGYESKREGAGFQQTYGLTTLKRQHISVRGQRITFSFLGKRSVEQTLQFKDKVIAQKVKTLLMDDEDEFVFPISEYQLRKFIATYIGKGFKAKDLRTFYANVTAYNYFKRELAEYYVETKKDRNAEIKLMVEHVAGRLGNTPAISKRSYIDHRLLEKVSETIY